MREAFKKGPPSLPVLAMTENVSSMKPDVSAVEAITDGNNLAIYKFVAPVQESLARLPDGMQTYQT
jgi:hypothetical protein